MRTQVSAWGGYVFIINLIPLHVFVLLLMGRFSEERDLSTNDINRRVVVNVRRFNRNT